MRKQILITGLALYALGGSPAELAGQTVVSGLLPSAHRGVTQVGTRGANFTRIGATARARAMGDAGAALLDEPAGAVFYNPAAAALAESFDVSGTWTDLYGNSGVKHSHLGAVIPFGFSGFAIQSVSFRSGVITPTREWTPYGYDLLFGDFMEWQSTSLGLSYARRITDRLAMGATAKYLQEGLELAKAKWWALDVGTVFQTGIYGLNMGVAVLNVGGESRFEGPLTYGSVERSYRIFPDKILGTDLYFRHVTEGIQLPTMFRMALQTELMGAPYSVLGGAGGPHAINAVGEVNDSFDMDIEGRVGVEYSFRSTFFVRGGKYFQNEDRAPWTLTDGLSFGAGVRLGMFNRTVGVDYAFTSIGLLGDIQSISVRLGDVF